MLNVNKDATSNPFQHRTSKFATIDCKKILEGLHNEKE